jgi:hypothetical protein
MPTTGTGDNRLETTTSMLTASRYFGPGDHRQARFVIL